MHNLKKMMQQSPKARLEAEFPIKGSGLLPLDSSWNELEVHNAILLYRTMIDNMYETSEYCNEDWKQVKVAKKVKQESSASKPNANTENCYRGSSTQLYVPAFPRRILTTFTITKKLQITLEYPTPQSQEQVIS